MVNERDDNKPETVEDIYDLLEMGSRVHTDIAILNRDFTLASTEQPLEKWATTQIYIANMFHDLVAKMEMHENERKKTVKQIKEDRKKTSDEEKLTKVAKDSEHKIADAIKKLLTSEVTLRLTWTRSHKGKVLNAILKAPYAGTGKDGEESNEEKKMSLWAKTMNKFGKGDEGQ